MWLTAAPGGRSSLILLSKGCSSWSLQDVVDVVCVERVNRLLITCSVVMHAFGLSGFLGLQPMTGIASVVARLRDLLQIWKREEISNCHTARTL